MSATNFQAVPAAVSALAFLGTGLVLVVLGALFLFFFVTRRHRMAAWMLIFGAGLAAAYLLTLFAFSLTSRTVIVPRGGEKYFCEVDCHLAYSVESVSVPDSLVGPAGPLKPEGAFLEVSVRTWFDPAAISPTRGRAPLVANPRKVWLVDAHGHRHGMSRAGNAALARAGEAGRPLDHPLVPGASVVTNLVFDMPAGVKPARLLITEADWITLFLIGNENSFFHRRTYLAL